MVQKIIYVNKICKITKAIGEMGWTASSDAVKSRQERIRRRKPYNGKQSATHACVMKRLDSNPNNKER